jgi:hypothetical protein
MQTALQQSLNKVHENLCQGQCFAILPRIYREAPQDTATNRRRCVITVLSLEEQLAVILCDFYGFTDNEAPRRWQKAWELLSICCTGVAPCDGPEVSS